MYTRDLRWPACVAVLFVALEVLGWSRYGAGTVVWLACGALLIVCWPGLEPSRPPPDGSRRLAAALAVGVVAACGWALVVAAGRALPVVFAGPPDPIHGDMLPVVNLGVDRFLAGHNPYWMYHLPWDVPLPYGPVLWLPYVLPHLLAFDSRVWTLAAALTVPAACGLAAAAVGRTRPIAAASLLALVVALAWQPQMLAFLANGHTLMYWPLLAVLAVLVARGRWTAACITAGLLVAARTTMVSIVPVLIIALHRRGELSWRRVGLVAAAALGPFLPFLIDDPRNVIYGMYGSYQAVVKGFVWHQTNWVATTFGTTRLLLARDLGRYVEPVQAAVLIVVYGAAWVALRARRSPLPWMVLALLAFSMTTLWPVTYVYFDVWVLAASGLAATAWPARNRAPGSIGFVAAAWALAATAVLVAGARAPGAAYSIDVGTPASTGMTGGGFGADTSVVEDGRTFVWVQGPVARIRLPRAGLFGARVRVTLRPYSPEPGLRQMVTAMLNERTLGTRTLSDGWQDITFDVSRSDWLYGFNVLDLHFAYAVSAASLGVGPDTTERSAAIDRVTIE